MFVLSTKDGDFDNACIVNTAVQVGAEPIRVAVSVQNNNYSKELIEKTGKFNVSVLTESVPFEVIKRFGMQTGREVNKFDGFKDFLRSRNGISYLTENVNAFFSAEVKDKVDLGSHTLFIAEVIEGKKLNDAPSCTYAHYHKAIKKPL